MVRYFLVTAETHSSHAQVAIKVLNPIRGTGLSTMRRVNLSVLFLPNLIVFVEDRARAKNLE
jgi:hypothetical protein